WRPPGDPDRGPRHAGAVHHRAASHRADGAPGGRRPLRAAHLPARLQRGAPGVTDDRELLGAHVSTLGGLALAPERGAAIGATAIQVFTKTPQQWREPTVSAVEIAAFRQALAAHGHTAVES